jgi:segregation and condensation protein A
MSAASTEFHPASPADGDLAAELAPTDQVEPGSRPAEAPVDEAGSVGGPAEAPADEAGAVGGSSEMAVDPAAGGRRRFEVHLSNFEGPFDLLLNLISKHKLDVTEVALSKVTDEFIAHIQAMGSAWDLGQATEFLVVAATLLDLKAARLLPAAQIEDEDDLALLEARDLLFARLLQYRAYKQIAAHLAERERAQARRHPRAVSLEPRYADALPEVLLGVGPETFAQIATLALTPRPAPVLGVDHLHAVRVSVREHAEILRARLIEAGSASFRALVADCQQTLEVVARFLAVLELYREGVLLLEQETPLGDLQIRWTQPAQQVNGDAAGQADMDEEYG